MPYQTYCTLLARGGVAVRVPSALPPRVPELACTESEPWSDAGSRDERPTVTPNVPATLHASLPASQLAHEAVIAFSLTRLPKSRESRLNQLMKLSRLTTTAMFVLFRSLTIRIPFVTAQLFPKQDFEIEKSHALHTDHSITAICVDTAEKGLPRKRAWRLSTE